MFVREERRVPMLRRSSHTAFVSSVLSRSPRGPIGIVSRIGGGGSIVLRHFLLTLLSETDCLKGTKKIVFVDSGSLPPTLPVPDSMILLADPFDSRSAIWDVAKDLTVPEHIRSFASAISDTFFGNRVDDYWAILAKDSLETIVSELSSEKGMAWTWEDLHRKVTGNSKTLALARFTGTLADKWPDKNYETHLKFSLQAFSGMSSEMESQWRVQGSASSRPLLVMNAKIKDSMTKLEEVSCRGSLTSAILSVLLSIRGGEVRDIGEKVLTDVGIKQKILSVVFGDASHLALSSRMVQNYVQQARSKDIQTIFQAYDSSNIGGMSFNDFLANLSALVVGGGTDIPGFLLKNSAGKWKLLGEVLGFKCGIGGANLERNLQFGVSGTKGIETLCIGEEGNIRKVLWPFIEWPVIRS